VEGAGGEVGQHCGTRVVVLKAMTGLEMDRAGLSACMCSKRRTTDDISLLRGDAFRPVARCRGTAQGGEARDSQGVFSGGLHGGR
jgi:hypothetical protein